MIQQYVATQREAICEELRRYLQRSASWLANVNEFGPEVAGVLDEFIAGGKMVRGAFVVFGAELCGAAPNREHLRAAAALELVQSFLLIHDDIMDRDTTRRGKPSVYYSYAQRAEERGIADAEHYGASMGICIGDVAMLLAVELISELELDPALRTRVVQLLAREIAQVGLAQMKDVEHGVAADTITAADVVRLYRYKTGRYTFSLPLMTGAIIAGREAETVGKLGRLGEELGVIFQIKDDQLGLFGSTETIGKPVGSDIRADKKTLFRLYLFRSASDEDRERLAEVFGSQEINERDLEFVHDCLQRYRVPEQVEADINELKKRCERMIAELEELTPEARERLADVLAYNLVRER